MELDHYVYLNYYENSKQEYESDLETQKLSTYPGSPDLCSGTHLVILWKLKQEDYALQYQIYS